MALSISTKLNLMMTEITHVVKFNHENKPTNEYDKHDSLHVLPFHLYVIPKWLNDQSNKVILVCEVIIIRF